MWAWPGGELDRHSPASHSRMAYHAARAAGVPARLVCYPELDPDLHTETELRDVAERTCAWFLQHMPPAQQPV